MPLEVVIAGAGISGLCTAVALHQNGHSVKVFEKSHFSREVESSFLLTPNAVKVLLALGFDFEKARADDMTYFHVFDGTTLQSLNHTDGSLRDPRDEFGTPLYTVHRNDLVTELLRLGKGLDVRLGTKVSGIDEAESALVLENGERYPADLIVAGDGLHSVLRATVLKDEIAAAATPSGLNAFRFMIPTELLQGDEVFLRLQREVKGKASCLFCDPTRIEMEHHIVWFTCRNKEMQVFVGIHESDRSTNRDLKELMLEEFGHYHQDLKHIISVATDVTDWPLSYHEPLETWHRGKIVLTGDAAHPMLPLGAQGACQAIEDAGALHSLLDSSVTAADVPKRLVMYEKVRRLRASRAQTLSNVRLGREKDVYEKLKQYADPPGSVQRGACCGQGKQSLPLNGGGHNVNENTNGFTAYNGHTDFGSKINGHVLDSNLYQ
ncbi:6-hydroxynicotinate 3-monooxygenase [Cytospora mali]|uniref:6-hydroxynicotinate 3-monooxygenase n=1 Tax=Cytospora mali TaxID=578113 RepID=A0A194VVG6_CYTMA|nr:6-hydroxynicotinate 3-monooxygenase [Valsa mali]